MKKQNIIIVAVIMFLLGVVQSSDVYSQDLPGRCDDKEQNLMRTQADAFLRGMPSDLQQRQTTAIRSGRCGVLYTPLFRYCSPYW